MNLKFNLKNESYENFQSFLIISHSSLKFHCKNCENRNIKIFDHENRNLCCFKQTNDRIEISSLSVHLFLSTKNTFIGHSRDSINGGGVLFNSSFRLEESANDSPFVQYFPRPEKKFSWRSIGSNWNSTSFLRPFLPPSLSLLFSLQASGNFWKKIWIHSRLPDWRIISFSTNERFKRKERKGAKEF